MHIHINFCHCSLNTAQYCIQSHHPAQYFSLKEQTSLLRTPDRRDNITEKSELNFNSTSLTAPFCYLNLNLT